MTMDKRSKTYNFNAGPTALPQEVLEEAQRDLLDYKGSGMSIMEMSHRSKTYEEVHNEVTSLLKELLNIPDDYHLLYLQGGASLQFAMVPMNFLGKDQTAGYILTGSWSEKALKEAQILGNTKVIASTKENHYKHIPALSELHFSDDLAYVHLTSNNTIYGTQWKAFPDTGQIPLIADMSSDILSRPIDVNQFALIYAGAQKNLGPSGVTLVILHKNLLEKAEENLPTMLKYSTHAKNNSLYNTPPTFGIYMLGLVAKWVKKQGGLEAIFRKNEEKAALIYEAIDESDGFYVGHAEQDSRSLMNITFRLRDEELEKKFLEEAKEKGFVGLNGHRSVGGCRASTYNAVTLASCQALREFMFDFQKRHQ